MGSTVLVWDAETGDPISPPLCHGREVIQTSYDTATRQLSTATHTGLYKWNLKPVSSDLEDLESLAGVVSGLRLDSIGSAVPILPNALAREFNDLKAHQSPESFIPDADALAGWNWSAWEGTHGSAAVFNVSHSVGSQRRERGHGVGLRHTAVFHLSALVGRWPRQPFLRRHLAETILPLGRSEEASALLEEELKLERELPGCERLDIAGVLLWLGRASTARGKPDDARHFYQQALELARSASGEKSLDVAHIVMHLGHLEHSAGNFATAEGHYRLAIDIVSPVLPVDDVDWTILYLSLARSLFRQDKAKEAESLLLKQYERVEKSIFLSGRLKPELLLTLQDIVGFYQALGKPEKAEPFAQRLEAAGYKQPTTKPN